MISILRPSSWLSFLGEAWVRWQGCAALADHMKQRHGHWVARFLRWGMIEDPDLLSHVLLVAIVHADQQVVEAVLSRGVDPDRTYKGSTSLHWAMVAYSSVHEASRRTKSLAIVELLLHRGADMQCLNRHGLSAWQEMEHRPSEVGDMLRAENARRQSELLCLNTPASFVAPAKIRRI